MSARAIVILVVMAVVSTAAAMWSYQANHRLAVDVVEGERVLSGLVDKVNDVAAIEAADAAGTIRLERGAKGWAVAGSGYPADPEKLQKILVALVQLSKLEAKTAAAGKYAQLNVDDHGAPDSKARLVTLMDKDGSTIAAIVLGKLAPGRAGQGKDAQYVRVEGEAQSWLALGRVDAASDIAKWVDPKVVAIRVDQVERARIIHADGEVLVVFHNGTTEAGTARFEIAGVLPKGKKIKSDIGVRYTATDLANVEFVGVRPVKEGTTEVARVELEMADGLKIGYRLVEDDGKGWITVSVLARGKDESEAAEIARRTAGWEYQLSDYKQKQFKKRLAELLE